MEYKIVTVTDLEEEFSNDSKRLFLDNIYIKYLNTCTILLGVTFNLTVDNKH